MYQCLLLYVKRVTVDDLSDDDRSLPELWAACEREGRAFWREMDALVEMLDEVLQG